MVRGTVHDGRYGRIRCRMGLRVLLVLSFTRDHRQSDGNVKGRIVTVALVIIGWALALTGIVGLVYLITTAGDKAVL